MWGCKGWVFAVLSNFKQHLNMYREMGVAGGFDGFDNVVRIELFEAALQDIELEVGLFDAGVYRDRC